MKRRRAFFSAPFDVYSRMLAHYGFIIMDSLFHWGVCGVAGVGLTVLSSGSSRSLAVESSGDSWGPAVKVFEVAEV